MKYKYKVNGLDCANCTQKLEDALNKKEEINDCVISFATGMMTFMKVIKKLMIMSCFILCNPLKMK